MAIAFACAATIGLVFGYTPARNASRLDPEARQERLVATVMKLVEAGSRREPVVFLLEDLHWADAASEAFLESLVMPSKPGWGTCNLGPEANYST